MHSLESRLFGHFPRVVSQQRKSSGSFSSSQNPIKLAERLVRAEGGNSMHVAWYGTVWAQSQDFQIPKPNNETPIAAPVQHAIKAFLPATIRGPSTTELIIAVIAAVAAAGLFLLLRSAFFNHLIEKRVPPSSAGGASWAFYVFLTATTWVAIVGFIISIWSSVPFLAGAGIVSLATLVFFVVSYRSALRRAR